MFSLYTYLAKKETIEIQFLLPFCIKLCKYLKNNNTFLCPRHSNMPPPFEEWWRGIKCYPCPCVRVCVRLCVRLLSKFGVRSITFERLHRFDSNLVCLYKTSKHRSSSIWVTTH